MVTRAELIEKYRNFFESKGHKWIPGASLVPENDPTVLFTTAGMHPLVPYLMGEPHAEGKRLANVQKCIRTGDIEEVGDPIHHTFFEMLGFWSLGDYSKEKSIPYTWELFTEVFEIDPKKLAVSVFEGDVDAPFDEESYKTWLGLGISEDRIAKLPKSENWWGPAGTAGPCGPDTEIFYWIGKEEPPAKFDPANRLWSEIGNNVFMQYNKTAEGQYEPLAQKNVDTGIGLIRVLAVMNKLSDNYQTELYAPLIEKIESLSGTSYEDNTDRFRIIADHITAAAFAVNDHVSPSNKGAGYVVRRLIRRAITKAYQLGIKNNFAADVAGIVIDIYGHDYHFDREAIISELEREETRFRQVLENGLREFEKKKSNLSGSVAFDLYQSYGFPLEMTVELAKEQSIKVDIDEFQKAFSQHQELSRTASAGMFKGGLADAGEVTTKYHTATHLLQAALRQVLGDHVFQKGSNITPERLRFDFSHPDKMTEEQIKQVENIVNEKIKEDLPVMMEEMTVAEAKEAGALGVFEDKYGSKVKVYSIGGPSTGSGQVFSREICGGPHVGSTGDIGGIKITKEEASSAGVRRIKATLV